MEQNRKYLLSLRNIVKTDDGYVLQKVYEENKNGEIVETTENKSNGNVNGFIKNCYVCIHNRGIDCLLRTKLENAPQGHYYQNYYTYKCDAFDPVLKLNLIRNEEEMIQFIEKTKNFFTEAVKEEEKKEENVPVEEESNKVESKSKENMTETTKDSTKESTENTGETATTTE